MNGPAVSARAARRTAPTIHFQMFFGFFITPIRYVRRTQPGLLSAPLGGRGGRGRDGRGRRRDRGGRRLRGRRGRRRRWRRRRRCCGGRDRGGGRRALGTE